MELFDSALLLVIALLFSAVLTQFVPKISTPLIQVGIGIFLALGPISFDLAFEPELFMVLFIAPLLFNDGKMVDKKALWNLKGSILSLALGLVLATVLCIGYFTHWMIPSIPLAAAFALAAALAPTDAVAVSAIGESVNMSNYESHLLEGESLINDASGVVSFQFAVAAMVTGTFSLIQAGESFLITFLGGIAVGLALGLIRYLLVKWLRSTGVESTTFHVLIEILMPFVVYIIAERVGVSGILAVVAAGIAQTFGGRTTSPNAARLNIVSTSVWSVVIFVLNGLVFLTVGTQLPSTLRGIWTSSETSNAELIGFVLAISAAMLLLRFVWALIMPSKGDPQTRLLHKAMRGLSPKERRKIREAQPRVSFREEVHQALVLSLGGVKGSITLVTVLAIPTLLQNGSPFPERNLIIFLASAAIVVSLLVANFILPLIAPLPHEEKDTEGEIEASIEILRTVMRELSWQLHSGSKTDRLATEEVISSYSRRIARIKSSNEIEDTSRDRLRAQALGWEHDHTLQLLEAGETSRLVAYTYLYRLNRGQERLAHRRDPLWFFRDVSIQVKHHRKVKKRIRAKAAKEGTRKPTAKDRERARLSLVELQVKNYDYVLKRLKKLAKDQKIVIEDASTVINEYTRRRDRALWQALRKQMTDRGRSSRATGMQAAGKGLKRTGKKASKLISSNGNGVLGDPSTMISPNRDEREEFETRVSEVEAQGLQYERETIQSMLEHGKITPATAKALRDNVALMELDIEDTLGY